MNKIFNKDNIGKIILVVIAAILLFLIILNIVINKKETQEGIVAREKNIELVEMKKIDRYDYELSITNQFDRMAVIKYNYNLNGLNNDIFYEKLDIAPILDTYDETGLQVISGHEFSFFGNLKNTNPDDVLSLRNIKSGEESKYKPIKIKTISKNDGSDVYDRSLSADKHLVTYTCDGGIFSLDPPNRIVVVWEKIV